MKQEPVSMTLVDLVSLVAGVAISLAILRAMPGLAFIPPAWTLAVMAVSNLFQGATIVLSVVALGRVMTYRRMPRSAEWLAIFVSVSTIARLRAFQVDLWVNGLFATFPAGLNHFDFDGWRWLAGGLASAAVLFLLAVVRMSRAIMSAWLKTLFLAEAALLALAGPITVFGFLGDDLVSPSEGFGPGELAILNRKACELFGFFPAGLFFSIPAIFSIIERRNAQPWTWSQWASISASTMVASSLMIFYRWEIVTFSFGWVGERLLVFAWMISVAVASLFLIRYFGSAWNRWVDGPVSRPI